MPKKIINFCCFLCFFFFFTSAVTAAVDPEVEYILNTFSFLVCGFLVMWMCDGFLFLD